MEEKDIDQLISSFYEKETENIEIPEGLEKRINTWIDDLEAAEKPEKSKTRRLWITITSIAAAIAIVLSVGISFQNNKTDNYLAYADIDSTINDPEEAYLITVKALEMVSQNMNKGLSQIALVESEMKKANEILDKTFK